MIGLSALDMLSNGQLYSLNRSCCSEQKLLFGTLTTSSAAALILPFLEFTRSVLLIQGMAGACILYVARACLCVCACLFTSCSTVYERNPRGALEVSLDDDGDGGCDDDGNNDDDDDDDDALSNDRNCKLCYDATEIWHDVFPNLRGQYN